MSAYWDVLSAVYERVAAIEALAQASPKPIPVSIYKKPSWNDKLHKINQCLVCMREDFAEELDGGADSFERGAGFRFPVWVGLIRDERYATEDPKWFLDRREDIWRAVWDLSLVQGGQSGGAGVTGGYDVEYDPSGAGAKRSNAPNVDESWQKFTLCCTLQRATGEGGF